MTALGITLKNANKLTSPLQKPTTNKDKTPSFTPEQKQLKDLTDQTNNLVDDIEKNRSIADPTLVTKQLAAIRKFKAENANKPEYASNQAMIKDLNHAEDKLKFAEFYLKKNAIILLQGTRQQGNMSIIKTPRQEVVNSIYARHLETLADIIHEASDPELISLPSLKKEDIKSIDDQIKTMEKQLKECNESFRATQSELTEVRDKIRIGQTKATPALHVIGTKLDAAKKDAEKLISEASNSLSRKITEMVTETYFPQIEEFSKIADTLVAPLNTKLTSLSEYENLAKTRQAEIDKLQSAIEKFKKPNPEDHELVTKIKNEALSDVLDGLDMQIDKAKLITANLSNLKEIFATADKKLSAIEDTSERITHLNLKQVSTQIQMLTELKSTLDKQPDLQEKATKFNKAAQLLATFTQYKDLLETVEKKNSELIQAQLAVKNFNRNQRTTPPNKIETQLAEKSTLTATPQTAQTIPVDVNIKMPTEMKPTATIKFSPSLPGIQEEPDQLPSAEKKNPEIGPKEANANKKPNLFSRFIRKLNIINRTTNSKLTTPPIAVNKTTSNAPANRDKTSKPAGQKKINSHKNTGQLFKLFSNLNIFGKRSQQTKTAPKSQATPQPQNQAANTNQAEVKPAEFKNLISPLQTTTETEKKESYQPHPPE